MRKFISVFLCAVIAVVSFTGCAKLSDLKYDVVLITDGGTVTDGAYNESAWQGVKDYSENSGADYKYYQPALGENQTLSTDEALKYIDLAVNAGAKFIVLPGEVFEAAAYEASHKYADVNFLLIDGTPHPENDNTDAYLANVMCISFNTLQSSFLAGYSAVISGNTKLGYFGSYNSDTSNSYGAGFAQGAAYAADSLGIPVTLDYADYDSPYLNYSYDFTITANYEKIDDLNEDCYVVNVVNGSGSGTYTKGTNVDIVADPAPQGKVFDHWECKSDTQGIKDKKVNLSTKKKTETNLLVENCSCTITAVYRDAESTTYPVIVQSGDNDSNVYSEQYIMAGESCSIKAPAAESGMVFDHWQINTQEEGAIDDINAADTWVHVSENTQGITLIPVYTESKAPTFNVTVITGEGGNGESTGSGSYAAGASVSVAAAVPKEGYIFKNWSNSDENGYGTGTVMDNEFYPYTEYTMVNRCQALVENMYNKGVSIVYAGGNDQENCVAEATKKYSYQKYAIGSENGQTGWENYYSVTVKDYGSAVKACLENFKGSYTYTGDCSNKGIYMSFVDDQYKDEYDNVYNSLASGLISLVIVPPGYDVRNAVNSNCLSINYWINDSVSQNSDAE
ncbi:MAG: BMP family ABC transporter substrate-binding protein [Clostridiales bacterium]|nr:BMP family ABC transporter substrate-binding protein [Clostridiales bacterium]